jgi:hypothetical protein
LSSQIYRNRALCYRMIHDQYSTSTCKVIVCLQLWWALDVVDNSFGNVFPITIPSSHKKRCGPANNNSTIFADRPYIARLCSHEPTANSKYNSSLAQSIALGNPRVHNIARTLSSVSAGPRISVLLSSTSVPSDDSKAGRDYSLAR